MTIFIFAIGFVVGVVVTILFGLNLSTKKGK